MHSFGVFSTTIPTCENLFSLVDAPTKSHVQAPLPRRKTRSPATTCAGDLNLQSVFVDEITGQRQRKAIIVPYLRTKEELTALKTGLRDLLNTYARGQGYPHLFLVVDGLEELPDCNVNGELKEYRELFADFIRRPNVEIISGVDLMKSISSGCPGAFVGIGNCLITTRKDGKADVTYVGEDTNLSLPILVEFPSEPSLNETVQFLNTLPNTETSALREAQNQTPTSNE
jgi:hypothetical protein